MSERMVADEEAAQRVRQRLDRYLGEGLGEVHGWLEAESAEVMAGLLEHQVRTGVAGCLTEIGVHHGKSFLLLANGARDDERAVALDVFDDQARNVDGSGRGDREEFLSNVTRWAPAARVETFECSSLDVEPDRAREILGPARFFSVDGGHTAGITRHDLRLAEAASVDGGVVVLDDVLNPHWMGVLTGLGHYLSEGGDRASQLRPFALSENKLYLTTSAEHAEAYAVFLREAFAPLLGKRDVELHGGTVDVYGLGSARRRTADRERARMTRRAARTTRSERRLRRLRRELDQLRAGDGAAADGNRGSTAP